MAEANALEPDGGGKLLALDWNPPARIVRQFGWICFALLPLLAWFWLGRPGPNTWTPQATAWIGRMAALGAVLAALGTVRPQWLKPVFVGLCVLAYPLGLLLSAVLLRVVYYGVFTPIGWLLRARGRDSLGQSFDRNAASYWTPRAAQVDPKRYFRLS